MTWYRAIDADVIQDVQIGKDSSVFYHAVLRGDDGPIRIGNYVNIQDGCILHASRSHPITIEDHTTVGHGAILHGCTIKKNCLIGMGAILMDGVVIEEDSIVAAGSLVCGGKHYAKGSLILGNPAQAVRAVREEELLHTKDNAEHYVQLAKAQLLAIPHQNENVDC